MRGIIRGIKKRSKSSMKKALTKQERYDRSKGLLLT